MKHNFHLHATNLETGESMDYSTLGSEPMKVRLHFVNATFASPEDHDEALHRAASDHLMGLHHMHEIFPEDMVQAKEGEPAYIATVRRPGF